MSALDQWKTLRRFLEAHHAGEDPLDALDTLYAMATEPERDTSKGDHERPLVAATRSDMPGRT